MRRDTAAQARGEATYLRGRPATIQEQADAMGRVSRRLPALRREDGHDHDCQCGECGDEIAAQVLLLCERIQRKRSPS